MESLTFREHQVLSKVIDGRSNKEIASALGVKERTIKNYRWNIMSKMEAKNLEGLIAMCGEVYLVDE
jgi:two-component system response regulator FixJ